MFNGQCRVAFERYHQLLGGELSMLTFGESPMATEIEPRWHDRIVHVTLQTGNFDLAGADVLPQDYAAPQGFSILLTFEDLAKAEQVFGELAIDGEIKLPFQQTFWSSGFGVLTDRFGIPWEVSCG
jgi:PhnB protein